MSHLEGGQDDPRRPPGISKRQDGPKGRRLVYRHALVVRVTHWINVLCLSLLLMSGLQIFNAHPSLYWGQYGADADPSWLSIGAAEDGDTTRGVLTIGKLSITTTGILGVSGSGDDPVERGFPSWVTIP